MPSLNDLMKGPTPVFAPLVLDPLMAMMAEKAGFKALYLGGGATGYQNAWLEANLTLTEMAQAAIGIRAACSLPLILDAAAGWGDAMHMHRTVRLAEAAGFAALEIEDQILPKRAHHHVGIDHMVPLEVMVEKVQEAVRARRNPDTHIIARTIATRGVTGLDDAVRRCEAYHKAGADSLLVLSYTPESVRFFGERLPAPLVTILRPGGLASLGMSPPEMHQYGFRLLIEAAAPMLAAYEAMKKVYAEMAEDFAIRSRPVEDWGRLQKEQQMSIDMEALLEIERRTTEKPA